MRSTMELYGKDPALLRRLSIEDGFATIVQWAKDRQTEISDQLFRLYKAPITKENSQLASELNALLKELKKAEEHNAFRLAEIRSSERLPGIYASIFSSRYDEWIRIFKNNLPGCDKRNPRLGIEENATRRANIDTVAIIIGRLRG